MRMSSFVIATIVVALFSRLVIAAAPADLPPDPWPRVVDLPKAQMLVYQPQVNSWTDNRLDFRVAVAVKPQDAKNETFGAIFGTVRTQVDKAARTVMLDDLKITKTEFPTLPDRGAGYTAELQGEFAKKIRSVSLDRLEASLALAGIKPQVVEINNVPPQVIVSYVPAILIPIDGAPVTKPIANHTRFERIINTRAMIVRGGVGNAYYVHVYDGWLTAASLAGPWSKAARLPVGLAEATADVAKTGVVDMLDGGAKANPKPTLASGIPAIYTSQTPTELIVFKGQPDFVPITGTQLLWASNTTSDVFVNTVDNSYYMLLAGRWFRAPALAGPLTFVASDALPADFKRIPPQSLAGAVLPTVAGTPQAQEALIANSIPQTATVPLKNGPTFTPNFDGAPTYVAIPGTSLSYVVNSSVPVIQVTPTSYYAVTAGVWFTAANITGPWTIATSVPAVVYAIPPSSPVHYVTYVRIYGATPGVVYVGYTPGYLGTVVTPYGTVVYGTGYVYSPWIGTVWYPPPYTYGVAATPVYNPYVGFTYGFAVGLATAAWTEPYWGGAYYYPVYWGPYPCCATASANVYGHWANVSYSGSRTWYAGGGVAGTTASGTYTNARTGNTGDYNAFRQYNAWTGNATRGYDRTVNTPAGGSAEVARGSNYNVYTGQRSTANAASATGAGGSTYDRAGASTAGPEGNAHVGGGQTYNAKTGQTNTWGSASFDNNHYVDVNGNVYKNTGDGWQQQSTNGWQKTSTDTSWADRESSARATGESRYNSFANQGGRSTSATLGSERSSSGMGAEGFGGRFGGGRTGGGGRVRR